MNNIKVGAIGVVVAICAVLGLTILFGSWYTVDQSERAVTFRNGAVTGIADAGMHFKWPFIDDYSKVSLQNNLARWEKLEGYSHDQQPAHYMISVNWQVRADKVQEAKVTYGGAQGVLARIVTPNVLKWSKVAIGNFTAQSSIQDRTKLNSEVQRLVEESVAGTPAQITSVNVEDIAFLPDYVNSINARMIAEVAVQTERQNWEKEKVLASIKVTQAQAKADSLLAQKKADALGIELVGSAEAKAIKLRADALAANAALVELTKAEKWNGVLPTSMIPGTSVPFVNLK